MQLTLNQLRQHLYQKVFDVYDVFKNFFGEEYVDLQGAAVQDLRPVLAHNCQMKDALQYDDSSSFELSDEMLQDLEDKATQYSHVYVWWPSVTVSNEYNQSIVIYDLYAKVEVQADGCIPCECSGFRLNRATYTEEQFSGGYLHSHIRTIPKDNFTLFMEPCLGSGPIRKTINSLNPSLT